MERRLAAILAADVAGYSILMGKDEEGTLAALNACRHIIGELVDSHRGRVFGGAGDSIVAEFASPVEAVRCGLGIQRALRLRNANLPEAARMQFRIGVNLGDVRVDKGDLFGEGVNIAARLEQIATPGGIFVSDDIYRLVEGKVDAGFDNLGPRRLKNVAKPVVVHCIALETAAATGRPAPPREKPAIAVMPFANFSGDPEQDYFADGICEDIVIGLSKKPDILVISRNSTLAYKGRPAEVAEIGRKLDAQFVLEGSVRKSGKRLRITARLVDTATGSPLWVERYDREVDDIFRIQDEVVGSILHALGVADGILEKTARQRSLSRPSDSLDAYDCYLQGRHHFYRRNDSGYGEAEALFKKAIGQDPEFARAYSALAWLYFLQFKVYRTKSFEEIRQEVYDLAVQAIRLDPDEFRAHWTLGGLLLHQGKHAQSNAEFDRALSINPNDANLIAWSAEPLIYCGRSEEALERCRLAIRLNPNCPDWFFWVMGSAYFHLGRYDEALAALLRISAPDHARRLLAATYAHLGRMEEARAEAQAFLQIVPDYSVSAWARTEYYTDPKELARSVEGQRKAGLPE